MPVLPVILHLRKPHGRGETPPLMPRQPPLVPRQYTAPKRTLPRNNV